MTIRNIDDETKARLRVAAALAGHSMEEHVRRLIAADLERTLPPAGGLGTWMAQLFAGTYDAGFVVPDRVEIAEPIELPE